MTNPSPSDNVHLFLTTGTSLLQARRQATSFMDTTRLVIYQSISINDEEINPGTHAHFWSEIESGIAANHLFCSTLLNELQDTGMKRLEDLLTIQPGYPSKLLHILTHMLDGFFGTDSVFYNLMEDSHWLSEPLRATIQQNPENYWLVPVRHGEVTSSLLHGEQGMRQEKE